MKQPTPHKHAAMIAEWIKDTSRVVECCPKDDAYWFVVYTPSWASQSNYRFADQAPVKPEIVSSLSGRDCLMAIKLRLML